MIKTILRNLVSNAIKFSYPNDQIHIGATIKAEIVEIYIKDTGIGIKPDKQKSLFDSHEFIVTAGTSGEKGSGLGLPLCKELIEKQGEPSGLSRYRAMEAPFILLCLKCKLVQ